MKQTMAVIVVEVHREEEVTQLEKMVWAAVFAHYWEDPRMAIEASDQAVLTLRACVIDGRMHLDDDLENERKSEEQSNPTLHHKDKDHR